MKERPILMSAPMVRAILEGRKTQTRRVVKPQPTPDVEFINELPATDERGFMVSGHSGMWEDDHGCDERWRCPFGVPGDRLWVKETCFPVHKWKHAPLFAAVVPDWLYAADYPRPKSIVGCHHWTPSIFMPRAASRITLEITGISMEQLQDIPECDAVAEGVERNLGDGDWRREDGWLKYPVDKHLEDFPAFTARESYQTLWESINGAGSWAANPWVWAVGFRRVQA